MTDRPDISRAEFVTLMAMIMATIAFSIDAVLPALPQMASALTPDDPNRAQLVITSFMFGMGIGTLVTGPISDAIGRKPVMVGGVLLYSLGAALAWSAQSMEVMLAARILQGLGASGPRVVVMAMVRDKYVGSQMARIMSFVMIVFTLVPAIAPTAGAVIITLAGWRAVFPAGMVFALVATIWLSVRQPETHTKEKHRPISFASLRAALIEVMGNRVVQTSILVQALILGMMFGSISSVQSVIDQSFGRGDEFPMWFALVALLSAGGGFLNANLVVRLGMRRVARGALLVEVILCAIFLVGYGLSLWPDAFDFPAYLLWVVSIFFTAGMTMGNLNALALEPMGHIAGLASSIISCISTVLGVLIAAPIGLLFDGTPLPLAQAMLPVAALALLLMGRMRRSA